MGLGRVGCLGLGAEIDGALLLQSWRRQMIALGDCGSIFKLLFLII